MEPADEPRGVRAVHSCLLGHGCHVTQFRVLWEAARDDAVLLGLHQRLQRVSAWYAQSSRFTCGCLLGQMQGVFGWCLCLVQTVPEQQTCGIPHSLLEFILPTASVATCVLSNIGR
jgi:hypothetical protein